MLWKTGVHFTYRSYHTLSWKVNIQELYFHLLLILISCLEPWSTKAIFNPLFIQYRDLNPPLPPPSLPPFPSLVYRDFVLYPVTFLYHIIVNPCIHQKVSFSHLRPNVSPKVKNKNISTCLLAISEHFQGLVKYFHRKVGRPAWKSYFQAQTCSVKDAEGCHTR